MKIAISGVGLRAADVLSRVRATDPQTEFVGYVDPSPSHLDRIDSDIPAFETVPEMLEATQPDLFWIASPNAMHLQDLRDGLAAGVRIFTEKPVVTTIADTMELAALLAEHGTDRVMVGLVLRYSQHMHDLLAQMNRIGTLVSIEANEHLEPEHGAFFMRDWRRDTAATGGFMLEKCCHDLDIYNMITGSRPRRVSSFGGRRIFVPEHRPRSNRESEIMQRKTSSWNAVDDPFSGQGDIIDHQVAVVEFENGVAMTFHTNLSVPDEQRRFCVLGAYGMAEGDFARGYLKVTERDGTVVADHDYKAPHPELHHGHYGADQMMVDHMLAFLRGDADTLPVSIVDALEAGIAALAIDQARTTGQVVDLTETWKEFDAFGLRG